MELINLLLELYLRQKNISIQKDLIRQVIPEETQDTLSKILPTFNNYVPNLYSITHSLK